jgi:hypothetical protein
LDSGFKVSQGFVGVGWFESDEMGAFGKPLHLVFPQILVVKSFQPLAELIGGHPV